MAVEAMNNSFSPKADLSGLAAYLAENALKMNSLPVVDPTTSGKSTRIGPTKTSSSPRIDPEKPKPVFYNGSDANAFMQKILQMISAIQTMENYIITVMGKKATFQQEAGSLYIDVMKNEGQKIHDAIWEQIKLAEQAESNSHIAGILGAVVGAFSVLATLVTFGATAAIIAAVFVIIMALPDDVNPITMGANAIGDASGLGPIFGKFIMIAIIVTSILIGGAGVGALAGMAADAATGAVTAGTEAAVEAAVQVAVDAAVQAGADAGVQAAVAAAARAAAQAAAKAATAAALAGGAAALPAAEAGLQAAIESAVQNAIEASIRAGGDAAAQAAAGAAARAAAQTAADAAGQTAADAARSAAFSAAFAAGQSIAVDSGIQTFVMLNPMSDIATAIAKALGHENDGWATFLQVLSMIVTLLMAILAARLGHGNLDQLAQGMKGISKETANTIRTWSRRLAVATGIAAGGLNIETGVILQKRAEVLGEQAVAQKIYTLIQTLTKMMNQAAENTDKEQQAFAQSVQRQAQIFLTLADPFRNIAEVSQVLA